MADLFFHPLTYEFLIGAGIGVLANGVGNAANQQDFFDGWWKGAITGAVGGTLGQFGGGSLLNDVIWGTVEGGITGGIGASVFLSTKVFIRPTPTATSISPFLYSISG